MAKVSRYTETINYFKALSESDNPDEELKSFARSAIFYMRKYNKLSDDKNKAEYLMNSNRKWTEEEEAKLVEGFRKGKSIERLASIHHRTNSGIIARLVALGEVTDEGVAKRWTEEEEEKLRKEFARGKKLAYMAKSHNRTLGAINSRLILLGLIEE